MPEYVMKIGVPAALGVATVVILTLLIVLLRRQRANVQDEQSARLNLENTITNYMESLIRETDARQEAREHYDQEALLSALRDNQLNDAARVDALGVRLGQSSAAQDTTLRHLAGVMDERLNANDLKVERMRETLFEGLTKLQSENAAKLEEMRKTVDENLHQTLNRRLGESFSLVNERLEQVYKGLGEMRTLAAGVGDLKRVLTNVKTRGIWGEIQLGSLLAELLSNQQYMGNVAVVPGAGERVEYAVRLPGRDETGTVWLPIDAKFPIEAYERLLAAQEAADKGAYDAARLALGQAVQREAARIAEKYIKIPYTTDFAVMYLPIEGLFAEVLRLSGVVEGIQRQWRVVIAGPTTLAALINSLQMGFRTLAIEQRSAEVWQLLGLVKAEFGRFGEILEKTQQRLRQATESIESATRKTKSIERRLRSVESVRLQAMGQEDAEEELAHGPIETDPLDDPAQADEDIR